MIQKPLPDDELVASGKRSAGKTDCTSVIIATGNAHYRPPDRNYFLCDQGLRPHNVHMNAYDQWWIDADGNWKFTGESLKDPNFTGANP